jgi:hypothetical protein
VDGLGEWLGMNTEAPTLTVEGPPRPRFLADASNEKLWDVVLALSTELAATRSRLDALERVLAERGSLPSGAVDAWQPSRDAGVARVHDMQAYTQRVFETLARD